jgi:hypothetical protein
MTNALETLEAKRQFASDIRSHGVTVRHYHADNGRFIENTWVNDTRDKGQDMSYSGVAAPHQNGKAEKRIRDNKIWLDLLSSATYEGGKRLLTPDYDQMH